MRFRITVRSIRWRRLSSRACRKKSAYCFFLSWSRFDTYAYVTRLSSSVSKLWGFHREFNCPPRICPLFEKTNANQKDPPCRILYFLDSDLLPATPWDFLCHFSYLLLSSLRSIVNAIQFRRRENEGGIDRRMKFDILSDAAWKQAENRAWWHVGNHSNRFRLFLYIITNSDHS